MWPYWVLFLFPAVGALMGRGTEKKGLMFAWLAITLMVGYRVEVGGDWSSYLRHLEDVRDMPLNKIFALSDPGYKLLNWISVETGGGIYGVNLGCGLVFATGLMQFCRCLPRPWLAVVVAVPYLVIVVGMGYSRQGVALGFAMLGLVALQERSVLRFVIWIVIGATFHRTAVLLLPIAALASSKNRYWTIAWVGVVTLGAYELLLAESVDALVVNYVDAEYESDGALIRLAMNAIPAVILLWPSTQFRFTTTEGALWRWFAIISVVLIGILFVSPSSTAVDRIALYMLPLQIVVFSHLPDVFGRPNRRNELWVGLVVLYYAVVLFVWLNYASHAHRWIPYRFYPLEGAL